MRPFLVTALVEGVDVRTWSLQRSRSERLAVLVTAARAVEAAHRVGVVHRDIKPEHVLVDAGGGVTIVDFGLAALRRPTGDPTPSEPVGTPAYAAPELFDGSTPDTASDQFSLCIMAWEVLFGAHPFGPSGPGHLARKRGGRFDPIADRSSWAKTQRRLLMRGLAARPEHRWADLGVLADMLERHGTWRWRRWAVPGLAAMAMTYAVAGGAREPERDCVDEARIQSWSNTGSTGAMSAPNVEEKAPGGSGRDDLVVYLETIDDVYLEACRSSVPTSVFEATRSCLEERAHDAKHRLALLDAAAPSQRAAMRRVVDGILPVSVCTNRSMRGLAGTNPSPSQGARDVRDGLARALRALDAGDRPKALSEAIEARRMAYAGDWHWEQTESELLLGLVYQEHGAFELAIEHLESAYFSAVSRQQLRVAFSASSALLYIHGDRLGRFSDADRWASHARSILDRVGEHASIDAGHFYNALGAVRAAQGRTEDAVAHYRRAIEIWEKTPSSVARLAAAHANLGVALGSASRYEEAIVELDKALEHRLTVMDPDQYQVGESQLNLGAITLFVDPQAALPHLQRAAEIFEPHRGPARDRLVAITELNRGYALNRLERWPEAIGHLERALAMFSATADPGRNQIDARHSLALALHNVGRSAEAVEQLETAMVVVERTDDGRLKMLVERLAELHEALGQTQESIYYRQRAEALPAAEDPA
jgi:tetratricopeptide (TPR) repeat protein